MSAQVQKYVLRHGALDSAIHTPCMPRGNFIKAWREFRGLTQDELAELCETTAASISRYETGAMPYSRGILERIADALGCTPGELLMHDPNDAGYLLWKGL